MAERTHDQRRRARGRTLARARREGGAAMVEFAFVGVLLVLLLTGLISFGLILSFKQNLTQAAAEGARAGATALSADVLTEAESATAQAVASFDQTCNVDGLTCTWQVGDCGEPLPDAVDDPAVDDCITVEVTYDYDAFPLLPEFPILAAMYPDTLSASSTAETNP